MQLRQDIENLAKTVEFISIKDVLCVLRSFINFLIFCSKTLSFRYDFLDNGCDYKPDCKIKYGIHPSNKAFNLLCVGTRNTLNHKINEMLHLLPTKHCNQVYITFNPFTLRVPPESIVCYSYTFENNLVVKQKFTKYLKESCCLASD